LQHIGIVGVVVKEFQIGTINQVEKRKIETQIGANNVWNEYEKKFVELESYLNHE